MKHKLNIGDQVTLTIRARQPYSDETIDVKEGEVYNVHCHEKQYWIDLFIPASPAGYYNPLANLVGQRLKGTKCFCLCGVYDRNDTTAFEIGKGRNITCQLTANISFFANDVPGFDWNNWGKITINVKRTS